jgi:dolichyl-phosphate beta-glucosyltransferase
MPNNLAKIGIVIPCYNEANRLDGEKFNFFLKSNKHITLLFVNDGSTDDTEYILNRIETTNTNASILSLDQNLGKADAIRRGSLLLANRDMDYIGFWDADLSTPLKEIENIIQYFEADLNVKAVIGSRIYKLGSQIERRWFRHFFGRIITTILSFGPLKEIGVYDSQCGAKLFKREIVDKIFNMPFRTKWLFDIEILQRLNQQSSINQTVYEYPLPKWVHRDGSKIKIKDFYKIIIEIIRLFNEK